MYIYIYTDTYSDSDLGLVGIRPATLAEMMAVQTFVAFISPSPSKQKMHPHPQYEA